LGKSNSAISKKLQGLRETLGDELFTRHSSGLKATPYTIALIAKLLPIQKQLESAFAPQLFVANNYQGKIRIASNSALLHYYQPQLFLALKEQAPQAEVEIVQW
jgi:DNA-binding transcriptional LysR family regulator